MLFVDTMTITDAPHRSADGYLAVTPRVARTGIQEYLGRELGRPDLAVVRVYRPESEVFHKDALASFAHKPVTNDHPPEWVDASNWRKYSVGSIGDEVLRDGEFMRVPMSVMDGKAIKDIEAGKSEISMGYTADIIFDSGVTPTGEAYDAIQSKIRGNHLAIVDKARGGAQLRVIDMQTKPPHEAPAMSTKKIIVDGIAVEVPEVTAAIVERSLNDSASRLIDANAKVTSLQSEVATLTTKVATTDAELVTIKQQLADAKNPASIEAAVKSRAVVADSAKKIMPTVVIDGKTEAEIRAQVVTAKLGDAAKDWTEAQVLASFTAFAMSAPTDPYAAAVRDAATNSNVVNLNDAEAARIKRDADLQNAYKDVK